MDIEALVQFSTEHPWKPQYPAPLVRRFLTELISGPEMIFDLKDAHGRVAAAVLLDKVNNLANDACLEILGFRAGAEIRVTIRQIFEWAKTVMPKSRAGIQVSCAEDSELSEALLQSHGLAHYYDTYEMISDLRNVPKLDRIEIVEATRADAERVFEVLCKSFANSPDTSISEWEVWNREFLRSPQSKFFLWKERQDILGFANLIADRSTKESEVRTIGVLPGEQGKGIGRQLLHHCLTGSIDLGLQRCHLTVAVTNENALGLYLRSGFKTVTKNRCFRWSKTPGTPHA